MNSGQIAEDVPLISRRRLNEALGLLLCGFSLYLLLALFGYHGADPSWNVAAERPVENFTGSFGAFVADLYLQFLGLASVIAVAVPFAWGWRLVREDMFLFFWLRFSALILGCTLFSSLLAMVEAPDFWSLSEGLGGAIGSVVHDHLRALVPGWLLLLVLLPFSAASLWLAFGLEWSEWKGISRRVAAGFRYVASFFQRREGLIEREETLSLWQRVKARLGLGGQAEDDEEEEDGEEEEPRRPRVDKSKAKAKSGEKEAQASFELKPVKRRPGRYEFPALGLLAAPPKAKKSHHNDNALEQNARLLESVLQDFGVNGEIVKIRPGPVVTLYELEPAAGTKSSRVIGLADDIARSMSAVSARIAVIPGRNAIGIELPNAVRETVFLRELLDDNQFSNSEAKLPLAMGKDIGGEPIIVDLARMPHVLVAGTTGSGKSVAINTMIMSLVYHLSPDECKFIMIDPKMLELSVYDGIPHLLSPVVTEPGKAVVALKWTVKEMENRYRLMSNLGVRNIDGYNKRIREAEAKGEELHRTVQTGFDPETGKPIFEEVPLEMTPLPYIVVIVDEMADLMLVGGKDIESSIQRLAQMARAAGIHIIMATQRPSVDVITGVIKANFPTRVSFQVTSRIDSRTILGEQGAEQLLGQGDMLYMAGGGRITRIHGPFVSDKEVEHIVAHLKAQGEPAYIEGITEDEEEAGGFEGGDEEESEEERALYDQAVAIVCRDRKASTSYIQRCLKIGYNRAASIIDRMEREGVVSAANHVGKREVLAREVD